MNKNLKLVINNTYNQIEERQFFEKNELKIILDLYAKMVSEGSWKDYGLNISSKQVSFSVFKNAAENALYKICKNFKPNNKNLKLIINNSHNKIEEKQFFEKNELKIILDLYAKMVSEGSWKDYGLNISIKQVSFSVFKNATENALYKICKNFKPNNKNLKYLITDTNGKILKNSFDLRILLKNTNWKKFKR